MDIVYFQLRFPPRVHFISLYIPPSDSPYFCLPNLAWMNVKIQDNPTDHFLVMGDTNTRFGPIIDNFPKNHASARCMFFTLSSSPSQRTSQCERSIRSWCDFITGSCQWTPYKYLHVYALWYVPTRQTVGVTAKLLLRISSGCGCNIFVWNQQWYKFALEPRPDISFLWYPGFAATRLGRRTAAGAS